MKTYAEDKTLRSINFYARRMFGFRAIDNPTHSLDPFVSVDLGVTLSDLIIFVTQDVSETLGLTEKERQTIFGILSDAADRRVSEADPMTTPLVESEEVEDDEPLGMTDVEADADTLASAGHGTDEDYGSAEEVL